MVHSTEKHTLARERCLCMYSKDNYSIELAANTMTEQTDEDILLIAGDNQVTATKVILEGNTYNVADITTVRMVVKPVKLLMPVSFLVIGGMLILNGFVTIPGGARPLGLVIGVSFIVFGLMLLGDDKPTYCVRISNIWGEIDTIISKDPSTIQSVVDAINTALMKRMHGPTQDETTGDHGVLSS